MSVENNIIIATFMGMSREYSYIHSGVVYVQGFSTYNEDELKYNTCFDWIVPVAQEIMYKYLELSIEFDLEYKKNPYDKKHMYNTCIKFIKELKK